MLTLVTGGSASGKSEYAESLVVASANSNRWYIATMQPFDAECRARIERHRQMRQHKGFTTLECFRNLPAVVVSPQSVVLLECMSNLVANELFDPKGAGNQAEQGIATGVKKLLQRCEHLIIVSNEVFADGIAYDAATANYLAVLGRVNQQLAALADTVVEVVCGIPIYHKQAGRVETSY